MNLNKKGMTLVELIISVALLSIIVGFLFKILLDVKYESDDAGFAINNQVNRSEIIKTIQYDFEDLGINEVFINSNIVTFKFTEEEKKLEVDDTTVKYDSKKWTIKDNNYIFGEITLDDSIEGYWKITIPVVSVDGTNESSIDDIILFTRYKEVKDELPYLKDLIFANTTVVTTIPDFSIAAVDENVNLYKAEDDYGTSYYFRGASLNNYVEFAGYYWRVVRINGNSTIRLIYDGTSVVDNGEPHYAIIGFDKFTLYTGDWKYAGYTYTDGVTQKSNNIKEQLDSWYANNLEDNYHNYIADTVFCNDREVLPISGPGGLVDMYAPYDRVNNYNPILKCNARDDSYTVYDTTHGNGLLTKPVGTLTVDELMMAGAVKDTQNEQFYLYSDDYYWTMSPESGEPRGVFIYELGTSGRITLGEASADHYAIRPVINLKADVIATGTGTVSDPYVVDTE